MRRKDSLPPDYFEDMFVTNADPWGFATSAYETAKYDASIASLGGRRYQSAIEVGCANGVLTRRLHEHAVDLLAIDISETALRLASARCEDLGVRFERRVFPGEAPRGQFDLIVMSEVAYYLGDEDLEAAACWIDKALAWSGDLLLVHWTGETDYPQSGDDAVAKLEDAMLAPIARLRTDRREQYRLDLWRRG